MRLGGGAPPPLAGEVITMIFKGYPPNAFETFLYPPLPFDLVKV